MFPKRSPRTTRGRRSIPLAVACVALLAAPACAGSDGDDAAGDLPSLAAETADDEGITSDDGDAETADDDEEVDADLVFAEFEQCMQEQGIDMSMAGDGGFTQQVELSDDEVDGDLSAGIDGEDAGMAEFEAAAEVCDPILEDAFGSFEMTPEQEAEAADQMAEMQRCLADEGIEIDVAGGNSFMLEIGEGDDTDALDAAMEKCAGGLETIDVGGDS